MADRGAVTAEFAVALPAALVVLTLGVGAVGVAAQQVRLTQSAASIARMLARGDDEAFALSRVEAGTSARASHADGLVCVQLTRKARPVPLTLTARECALGPS